MSQPYIPKELRRSIAAAARYRCGYCLSAQDIMGVRLHVEHIIPLVVGGLTIAANLWLACPLCNGYKGIQTHAFDPETGAFVPLFNPRTQNWRKHFAWSEDGTKILGQTPVGRATVLALQLNNEYIVPARRRWVAAGGHPPSD
jgi:5-methylcytosine-specific restriction endonuclease McrA